jgi:RecJ-like exonuclease
MIITTECPICCGMGEIVTDWDRYLGQTVGDGDEAVRECPNCEGFGTVDCALDGTITMEVAHG